MSFTGLDVFDTTVHKTSVWLGDMMEEMHWEDRHRAYSALRAVLHTLRDRLTIDEAANLGAQLPMLIRGFYYEGWRPAGKPLKYRSRDEFLEQISRDLPGMSKEDLEKVASAVLHVVSLHVTANEVEQVRNQLPEAVRELWH